MNDKTSSAQSGGIAQGDNAQGNTNVAGGVGGDVVGRDKHTHIYEAQAATITSLHQIQPPPRDFTGREAEIKELMELLEHGGVTISGLHGLGGVGKTTLALKLAEALKDKYPDAQFYLDLKGADAKPLLVADALAHVIRAYHPTAKLPESVDELRALYLSVLHDKRALLLMDNARDEQQVEPLIPPSGCLLMVTSRFHFAVPGLKVKNLDALLPEDAVKLLLEIAPRIGDQAAEIARLCGNLPLGLRLAASFLSTRANYKVAEYVRKLSDATERLKLIGASLSLSYELLREELQANWRALAVFPDSFDQRAAAAVWELGEDQAQERLGDLLAFSLVEWSEETDRYRLHDLARIFADSRLTEAERLTHQQRHAEHFLQVLKEAERLYDQGGEAINAGLALFDREWGNVQASCVWVKANANAIPRVLELRREYPNAFAHLDDLKLNTSESILWQKIVFTSAQKLDKNDEQSMHLGNPGLAYLDLGEIQRTIELFVQVLATAREIGRRRGEGLMLGILNVAFERLGDTQHAIELFVQALATAREIGGSRGDEGQMLINQEVAHVDLSEIQNAIVLLEQCLAICRKIGKRCEALTTVNQRTVNLNLGVTHGAIELCAQVLTIAREIGRRRSAGDALWSMAAVLGELGDRSQAVTLAEAALVISEQLKDCFTAEMCELSLRWPNK